MKATLGFLLAAIALSGCGGMSAMSMSVPSAVAHLKPTQGNAVNGTVRFVQKGDVVAVEGQVDGLTPGLHGFHVHEKGDCSAPDAMSAGGHFNPSNKAHGDPAHGEHHAGDLGNLNANASGNVTLKLSVPTSQFSLDKNAPNSIVGRALVVHADPDDLKTQPAGNSGKRVACGVIAMQ